MATRTAQNTVLDKTGAFAVGPRRRPSGHDSKLKADMADGQLVTLALNGDRRAFPILIRRYEPQLRGVVARRVYAQDEASEIVQDALASAWGGLQSYSTALPFGCWLRSIAINRCRDWGRSAGVRARGAAYLQDLAPEHDELAEFTLIRQQDIAMVRGAVARMPETLREIIILSVLEERPQRDVAATLGVSPKAVETRLRRARQWLRQALTRDFGH